MCYAIPAKLVKIDGHIGIVDYFGEERQILLDLDDLQVGDYVYAQGGVLVRKIPEAEALEILETWKEIFFELKKTDEALSKIDQDKLSPNALSVLQQVNLRKTLSKNDMLSLLALEDKNELAVLYEIANNVRQREHGNASCVHGIIEFSNYCCKECHYCGIRQQREIMRYRMSADEIVAAAQYAIDEFGFKAFVLQSGEDYSYDDAELEQIVKRVRQLGVLVFVSVGSRSKDTYKKLYDAGARAVLLRFETSNAKLFATLRPGTTLEERVELIKDLRQMGYVIATGFIIGLPGESDEDLINNILLTKYLQPDMYSFGPLIPTVDTPLADAQPVPVEQVLKTTAIARFADPASNILVTTALETVDPEAKRKALMAGANSLMINITPQQYKEMYSIYDNRAGVADQLGSSVQETVDLLYSLGRAPTDLSIQTRR